MLERSEIVAGLLDQARDKDHLDDGENDIFAQDAEILRAAAELLIRDESPEDAAARREVIARLEEIHAVALDENQLYVFMGMKRFNGLIGQAVKMLKAMGLPEMCGETRG